MGKFEYKGGLIFGAACDMGGAFGTYLETENLGYYFTDRGESL
jgi:hypothetical protein